MMVVNDVFIFDYYTVVAMCLKSMAIAGTNYEQ
jgi:hypothetical protein